MTILPSMTTADGERTCRTTPGSSAPVASMAELLPDGLVVVGADRRVRLVNAEALRILDIPDPADLIGLPVDDVLPLTDKYGRDWWAHADPWDGAASRTGHLEKLLVGPRGKEVLVTARYVRSAAGRRRRGSNGSCSACATPRPGSGPSATRRPCCRPSPTSCGRR